nr:hypothetical protein [Methylobacterium nonmethylotrophicum]
MGQDEEQPGAIPPDRRQRRDGEPFERGARRPRPELMAPGCEHEVIERERSARLPRLVHDAAPIDGTTE